MQRKLPALLPMLLVLVLVSAAFAALDLFPGERERGTLETLLVQPLHRAEILLAKAIAVFLVGYAGVLVNLASLQACALLEGSAGSATVDCRRPGCSPSRPSRWPRS
ncbi:MAG: ABC transporter permease subunit [Planctomycetota bacterium]